MTLLDTLRNATQAAHRRLEARLALLDPRITRDRYRRVLQALWGYHAPLESHLDDARAWEAVGLDGAPRRRAHRLRNDLAALGLSREAIDRLPHTDDLPPMGDRSHALGCVYVVEGSTLGGRVILRHLGRHLGLRPDHGARFFAGHGDATGARWRETCTALSAYDPPSPHLATEAADAAVATFHTMERWLGHEGVLG